MLSAAPSVSGPSGGRADGLLGACHVWTAPASPDADMPSHELISCTAENPSLDNLAGHHLHDERHREPKRLVKSPVRFLCHRMVCTEWDMIGADVRPDWSPRINRICGPTHPTKMQLVRSDLMTSDAMGTSY
jgi:hypothetical protein